ncbi:MAG: ATP-binding protein [Gaiellaceae bacterium]
MPQIEQLQVVHWGPLRPDAVELTIDGINVATGPNGTGKTCLLDAAKLMLGVDELKQKPSDYIFDGGGDAARRADRAYVKAIFSNPERAGRAGRVFADAGRGCEQSAHVTAICELTRERRRYTILPGAITWGADGRRLEDELNALDELGRSQWFGPRRWSELLSAAGVSRALVGVISIQQGETDKTLDGSPEDLLKRMLELTGKQQTLDDFRRTRAKLAKTKDDYLQVSDRFQSERRQLEVLNRLVARHEEYAGAERRRREVEELELPTAERRQLQVDLHAARRDRDARRELLDRTKADLAELEIEIPSREQALAESKRAATQARDSERQAQRTLTEAVSAEATAQAALDAHEQALSAAQVLLTDNETLDEQRVVDAARGAREAEGAWAALEEDKRRLEIERDELRAGHTVTPRGLDEFRALLAGAGIDNVLLAERLEVDELVAAEAALADGVWTLIVDEEQLELAVALAREHGHRLPLAAAGGGAPRGVFASSRELPEALRYLEEIDRPLVEQGEGVDASGVVRGKSWAAARAPERVVLGSRAREDLLRSIDERLAYAASELPRLAEAAATRRRDAEALARGLAAAAVVDEAHETWRAADAKQRGAFDALTRASDAVADILPRLGEEEGALGRRREQRDELTKSREERQRDWEGAERRVSALEDELGERALTAAQEALGELPTIDALRHELELLATRLDGFSEEERSELVLAEREEQAEIVAEIDELLSGKREVLEQVEVEVATAKERYDGHVRETVHALGRCFRDVCTQAGMEGELQLAPSSIEGESALDVRVAHHAGEPKRSYKSGKHSGGEKAKISLLLLLAAMSVEGAADLLIMDEHSAHLDSRNIDAVADLMEALKSRVQFILATPTNAEAGRLTWCDQQLAFFPRRPGDAYAPAVRLFTRLPEPRPRGLPQLELVGDGVSPITGRERG